MAIKTEVLHFYITGEGYTGQMLDFFRSGEFHLFNEMLGDGNLTDVQKRQAFELRMVLTGTTKDGGDLNCHFIDEYPDFAKTLYYAIRTSFNGILNNEFKELSTLAEMCRTENPDRTVKLQKQLDKLAPIFKYFTVEELFTLCGKYALREEGYALADMPESEHSLNGVILKDGSFIECGYQDHQSLFPVLYKMGLSDTSSWMDSEEVIHISSGSLNGTVAHDLEYKWKDDAEYKITPAQVATIWRLKDHIRETYGSMGSNTCMQNLVRRYTIGTTDKGGKYGNLIFLKQYFPEIPLPHFSLNVEDFAGNDKIFMRTSPKNSMPGLLNSRIIKPTEHDVTKARNFMQLEFTKFADLHRDNKLNWFFQELLEGPNGVCHVRREPNCSDGPKFIFSYQMSSVQGDVVSGKVSTDRLSTELEAELTAIATKLFKEIQDDGIQLEFVSHNNKIYIVQLRLLENEFEKGLGEHVPDEYLCKGLTFSKGKGGDEIDVKDILIVSEDAKSEELIGKKALIVETNVEFSHILALAKSLRIPAMYGTGKVDFKGNTKVSFRAVTKNAYCCKHYTE